MEASCHIANSFITLTYDDFWCPGGGNLVPLHLTQWVDRMRKRVSPLRYFMCGEYGDVTQRPHYHAILFGFPSCAYGNTRYWGAKSCCAACDTVSATWPFGKISCTGVSPQTFHYVAGYVTKKMTAKDDERLKGRRPEFARMSQGIGKGVIPKLAKQWEKTVDGTPQDDTPNHLLHGTRPLPIGRYLTRLFREAVGRDGKIPQASFNQIDAEMYRVRMAAKTSSEVVSAKEVLIKEAKPIADRVANRLKIHSRRSI